MTLPRIDVFRTPYEVWTERKLSIEESLEATQLAGKFASHAKDQLIARITTALEAAKHVASIGVDNNIDHFVDKALATDPLRRRWQKLMPTTTPRELTRYQREYAKCDLATVDAEINRVGLPLSPGQCLFHCGLWPANADPWVTTRPLSTSFCPQVALLNSMHRAKAYDACRVDLFVLQVQSSRTKAFAYKRAGAQGHEHEVLLAAGATLRLRTEERIRSDYTVIKWQAASKQIPVYVLQVYCD